MLRRLRFWLGLVLSLGFLGFFLARTDFGAIRGAFARADYWLALLAIPLYFGGFWIRTMRWQLLLSPVQRVATSRLYPVVLIGLMANNVAPARVGELVRAYLLGERESMSKSTALGTIAVDRAFDGLTLVAILGVVTAVSGSSASVKIGGVLTALAFFAATAILSLFVFSARARALVSRLLLLLPAGGLAGKLEALLDSFLGGLVVMRSPRVLLLATAASFVSWMIEGTMYYVVSLAFHVGVGFHVTLLILAAANLALAIVATPGGVGPFEVASKQILLSFHVEAGVASAYTLGLHALLLGPVILVGILLLGSTQLSFAQVFGGAPPTPATAPPE